MGKYLHFFILFIIKNFTNFNHQINHIFKICFIKTFIFLKTYAKVYLNMEMIHNNN